MNNRMTKILTFVLVAALAVSVAGCKLLHEKVVELVLRNTACHDFEERHSTANYVGDPQTFDIAADVDDALASFDPPLSKSDISEASLTSVSYEVTWLDDPGHDWEISGGVMIGYNAVEETIAFYDTQSLYDALDVGGPIYPRLNTEGVDLLNLAISNYLNDIDPYPEVSFWIVGDDCVPDPEAEGDSLNFDWTGCLHMYLVSPYTTEVFDLLGED